MTFNPQRAEALRSAIHSTLDWLRIHSGDTATLLTEHLALLQEAELIYLTDAFIGEGEIGVDDSRAPPDGRVAHGFNATCEGDRIVSIHEPIFPDIKELDEAAGRVSLRKAFDDPHAELRESWAPGQRWQLRVMGEWVDLANGMAPLWSPLCSYRRHPDDIGRPSESGWVEWKGQYPHGPIRDIGVRFDVRLRGGAILESVNPDDCRWSHDGDDGDIVAYKVVK